MWSTLLTGTGCNESDAALMRRVMAGETDRFAELVRRYRPALLRVARSRLGRDDWAEDVVQDALLAAFAARGTFDERYSFRTWLWTIVLNKCRRQWSRAQRRPDTAAWTGSSPQHEFADDLAPIDESEPGPLVRLLAQERAELLEIALKRLSEPQADALRLRFFACLRFQEIADTMGCSLGAAKNRVKSGLLKLAKQLDRETLTSESFHSQAPPTRSGRDPLAGESS